MSSHTNVVTYVAVKTSCWAVFARAVIWYCVPVGADLWKGVQLCRLRRNELLSLLSPWLASQLSVAGGAVESVVGKKDIAIVALLLARCIPALSGRFACLVFFTFTCAVRQQYYYTIKR